MRRTLRSLFAAALLLLPAASAHAGNNEGAVVRLSWARYAHVQDQSTFALEAPLYLTIEGAADIQAVAIDFRWTPHTIAGPCYDLLPNAESMAACGQTLLATPDSLFEGEPYDWTIAFATGADRSCVAFKVRGERCDGLPATFCAITVKLMDSEGQVDVVEAVASATLFGGNGECPSQLQAVYPELIEAEEQVTLLISAEGISGASWVELSQGTESVQTQDISIYNDQTIEARITVPEELLGTLDVTVGTSSGATFMAEGVITVETFVAEVTMTAMPPQGCDQATGQTCSDAGNGEPGAVPLGCGSGTCSGILICPSTLFNTTMCELLPDPKWYSCKVVVDPGGVPIANLPMRAVMEAVPNTGGHCHGGTKGAAYWDEGGCNFVPREVVDGETNAAGEFMFSFIAPEAAGRYLLRIWSTDEDETYNPSHGVAKAYCVRAFPLPVDMRTQNGSAWVGLTNTVVPGHPSRQYIDSRIYPLIRGMYMSLSESSHNIVPDISKLRHPVDQAGQQMADLVLAISKTVQISATVDDVSLPLGGLLDETEIFVAPHCGHRKGLSVDIKPDRLDLFRLIKRTLESDRPWGFDNPPGLSRKPRVLWHTDYSGGERYCLEWGVNE